LTAPGELPLLWLGLGNPGSKYQETRHNIGRAVIDFFLERFGGSRQSKIHLATLWEASIYGKRVTLVKTTTYMNLSGKAVRSVLSEISMGPETMVVFHDDMDLDLGRTKLKWKGGDAGHKGIRSIMETLQTDAFFRARIGIGRPPEGVEAAEYVLSRFSQTERKAIDEAMVRVAEGMETWARQGTTNALNFLNRRD